LRETQGGKETDAPQKRLKPGPARCLEKEVGHLRSVQFTT